MADAAARLLGFIVSAGEYTSCGRHLDFRPGRDVRRHSTARILYRFSFVFGIAALVCAVVFLFSPRQGIAVVMAFSLFGILEAAALSLVFGIAGFIACMMNSSKD